MIRILLLIVGYICGLFTTGYVLASARHIDIRHQGSGNIGATNSMRVMGPLGGILVLLGDLLKSYIPCMIVKYLFRNDPAVMSYTAWTGLGAVLGHVFPFYLHFNGGKGMSTVAGMLLALDAPLGGMLMLIFVVLVLTTRLVSLASCLCLAFMVAGVFVKHFPPEPAAIVCLIAALNLWRHKGNIQRLLAGSESKIEFRKAGEKK